jgi:hypothetical protein
MGEERRRYRGGSAKKKFGSFLASRLEFTAVNSLAIVPEPDYRSAGDAMTPEGRMGLLTDLDDGQKREISEDDYWYFLEVLPPVAMPLRWNDERWQFGFVEGYDYVYAFKQDGDRYFAQKTNLLNPWECGRSIEEQQQTPGLAARLGEEKQATRAASWIPTWIKLGKQNPWIREASDPPFNTRSFHACVSDDELLDKFRQRNWCAGQAFYRGNVCFINQSNGGGEWLTIKQDTPFESISFGRIIATQGREAAQAILDRIRAATIEQCRELTY